MRNFGLLFALTLRQLLARRRAIVLVLLALVPAALGIVTRAFGAPYPRTPFLETVPNLFTGFLLQVLSLFYGASIIRDAIEDRTATFVLTTPTSRTCYVLAVYAALVVNVLLLLELAILAAFLTWGAGLPHPFPGGVPFGDECRNLMWVTAVGACIYAALFMLFGLWTRHSAVIGVLYYMIFEVFLAFVPGPARRLAISAHLDALLHERFVTRRLIGADMFDKIAPFEISRGAAAATIAGVLAALATLMVLRARRHDFIDVGEAPR